MNIYAPAYTQMNVCNDFICICKYAFVNVHLLLCTRGGQMCVLCKRIMFVSDCTSIRVAWTLNGLVPKMSHDSQSCTCPCTLFRQYLSVTIGPPKNLSVTSSKGALFVTFSSPFNKIDYSMASFRYFVQYREEAGTPKVRAFSFSPFSLSLPQYF